LKKPRPQVTIVLVSIESWDYWVSRSVGTPQRKLMHVIFESFYFCPAEKTICGKLF
jgi:hypothetical protein